jgi:hypothetical protein
MSRDPSFRRSEFAKKAKISPRGAVYRLSAKRQALSRHTWRYPEEPKIRGDPKLSEPNLLIIYFPPSVQYPACRMQIPQHFKGIQRYSKVKFTPKRLSPSSHSRFP